MCNNKKKSMLKFLFSILENEKGGLGCTRASIVSAICDDTGDDSIDAVVKVKRLINRVGKDFCMITNWPFLRTDSTMTITTADYKYSGADYLPTTFKKMTQMFILHNSRRYKLHEVGINDAYNWANPNENDGIPDEFAITRIESGYWEIQFNRIPDQTYTVYLEYEKQWVDLTADDSETVVSKPYESAFVHFVDLSRFLQQGDSANYSLYKDSWHNPMKPLDGILARILGSLSKPSGKAQVVVDEDYIFPFGNYQGDYR